MPREPAGPLYACSHLILTINPQRPPPFTDGETESQVRLSGSTQAAPPVTRSPATSPAHLLLETRASPDANFSCTRGSPGQETRVLPRQPRPQRQTGLLSGPLSPLTAATTQSLFGIPNRLPDNQPEGALGSLPWSHHPPPLKEAPDTGS